MRKSHAPSRRFSAGNACKEAHSTRDCSSSLPSADENKPKTSFPKFRSPFPAFRSPLVENTANSTTETAAPSLSPLPVAKKLKIFSDSANANDSGRVPKEELRSIPDSLTPDKPVREDPPLKPATLSASTGSAGCQEQQIVCWNVMWRKPTNKKHKSWDGDGVLVIAGKRCILYDKDGSQIGSSSSIKFESLSEGDLLVVGGKEVEIDCQFDTSLYTSGRCFMGSQLSSAAAAPRPVLSRFKLDSRPAASSSAVQPKVVIVTPRHNPATQNALVMLRPPRAHERLWNSKKRSITDVVVDPVLCAHLRPHQREGVKFLYECVMGFKDYDGCGAILADEMGLGKTLQTITLLWTLLKQTPYYGDSPVAGRALVVCPATLTQNWKKEFHKWLGVERIRVYAADQKSDLREFIFGRVYTVLVIGYEKLRALQEILKDTKFDIVVCDEGHRLKSTSIKTTQSLSKLATRRRLILTGTPMQNDLGEFYAMVSFVNPSVFPSYNTFKKVYEDPIVKARQPNCDSLTLELGKQRSEELSRLTKLFILRRTAEVNASYLPPKAEIVLFCRPTPRQVAAYKSVLASPVLQKTFTGDSSQHLVCISILRRICNAPETFMTDVNEECALNTLTSDVRAVFGGIETKLWNSELGSKLKLLEAILSNVRSTTSEKIVIISSFTRTLDVIQAMCQAYNWGYFRLDGSTPTARRQEYVDIFNKVGGDKFIFLLSTRSGGVGLNLVGASRLVLFDVDWNPSVDLQAMARIHRENQKRKVYLYRFIMTGTIEEKIYQRQITKLNLGSSIMDNSTSETTDHFSLEELRDLFTLHEETDCLTHDLLDCTCPAATPSKVATLKQIRTKASMSEYLNKWSHISRFLWSDEKGGVRHPDLSIMENSEQTPCSLGVGDDEILSRTLMMDVPQKPDVSFIFFRQTG